MTLSRGAPHSAKSTCAWPLKPANGESYLQPVPLIEYQMDRERSTLTIRNGEKTEMFHAPDATGAFPNEVTAAGPVVFAGYGITAKTLDAEPKWRHRRPELTTGAPRDLVNWRR